MRGLQGKTILVAGGAGGIGTATSSRLGVEGAHVVVGDLDGEAAQGVAKQIEGDGGTAIGTALDISDESSIKAFVDLAVSTYGGIDGLHGNAADMGAIRSDTGVADIDLDVFDRTQAVNVRGHLVCTRHALPHLLERRGAVVYTTSAAAFVGEPERVAYAISKAGINALVRHVASKYGREGLRANAVAPGLVLTETAKANVSSEFREFAKAATRSDRLGDPADIAAMVAFLLSDDGAWINGQVISVDGGATLR